MQKGVIDRFEDDFSVIEIEGQTKIIPRNQLPSEAGVGDVVEIQGDKIKLDVVATNKRKQEMRELMDSVWED